MLVQRFKGSNKVIGSLVALLTLTSLATVATPEQSTASPRPDMSCPNGWMPRAQTLNSALGSCLPGMLAQPSGNETAEQFTPINLQLAIAKPDLIVQKYIILTPKSVLVQVANTGQANAEASSLQLTVRRINDVAVGRTIKVNLPSIPAQSTKLVTIEASGILPNSVKLAETTFRLDADINHQVDESMESNNTTWHNL